MTTAAVTGFPDFVCRRAQSNINVTFHLCQAHPSFQDFIPAPQVNEIVEPAALDVLASYKAVNLPVVGLQDSVRTAYVGPSLASHTKSPLQSSKQPLLLLHGFDSSAVEWRRLVPLLAPHFDVYAVDLLGYATHYQQLAREPPRIGIP
jgi:hypothetical protein